MQYPTPTSQTHATLFTPRCTPHWEISPTSTSLNLPLVPTATLKLDFQGPHMKAHWTPYIYPLGTGSRVMRASEMSGPHTSQTNPTLPHLKRHHANPSSARNHPQQSSRTFCTQPMGPRGRIVNASEPGPHTARNIPLLHHSGRPPADYSFLYSPTRPQGRKGSTH